MNALRDFRQWDGGGDFLNPFALQPSDDSPMRLSVLLALLLHGLLLFLVVPSVQRPAGLESRPFVVRPISLGVGSLAGGVSPPSRSLSRPPTSSRQVVPIPAPEIIPSRPNPVPHRPARHFQPQEASFPDIIGPVFAPPGRRGASTDGSGSESPGGISGDTLNGSTGVFSPGPDVVSPRLIHSTLPQYTDRAIQARAHGSVLLRGVVRKNGRVDTLTVIRGLGYGLEQKAIREISTNWIFEPGTRGGRVVDVWATIEVQFNLR